MEGKYKGKRKDTKKWVYGDKLTVNGKVFIVPKGASLRLWAYYSEDGRFGEIDQGGGCSEHACEVIPSTVKTVVNPQKASV